MPKLNKIWLILITILLWFAFSECGISTSPLGESSIPTSGIVQPIALDFKTDLIVNPGKGWIVYGNEGWWHKNLPPFSQSEQTWAVSSVGYLRYVWNDLEPQNEAYNWEPIDQALVECVKRGKKFAFGVMCCCTTLAWDKVTPDFVFDGPAKGGFGASYTKYTNKHNYTQKIPVWNDPKFITALQRFIKALAARYDNNPNIAFIDIRSYGNWGENHLKWEVSGSKPIRWEEFVELHLQTHLNVFRNTLLVTADSEIDSGSPRDSLYMDARAFEWARDHGIAGRNDGVIYDRNEAQKLTKFKDRLPAILEFWQSYQYMRYTQNCWSDRFLRQDIEKAYASYCVLGYFGDDGQIMYRDKEALVKEIGNRMGYHFVLEKVIYDSQGIGGAANMTLQWKNLGVAPIFIPAKVMVALVNPVTEAVVEQKVLNGCVPRNWAPGNSVTEHVSFSFDSDKGSYKLAIGLFSDENYINPDIKLGIQGINSQGWYIISDMAHQ